MKVAMLLSGGVDSSVALTLLKEAGHDVTAFYLKIWLEDEMSYLGSCPWEEDLDFAERTCALLDVPLRVVPLQREYHERVVQYTVEAVENGLTPNPDMHCNRAVKFGAFLEYLEREGESFDHVATGHYAQIEHGDESVTLKTAPDLVKDQTYFLALMEKHQLAKALFPIGHLEKKDVRQIAQEKNLPAAVRKDSQGICFLGKISFNDFIKHHLGIKPGDFVEKETGTVLGQHNGFYYYTIGQRRGIEINNGPWYVCDKDAEKNIVYVTHGFGGEDQGRTEFGVREMNWIIAQEDFDITKKYDVKLRHGPERLPCAVTMEGDVLSVTLDAKDHGITPGQYAVFYDDDVCVGGGVIL